MRKVFLFFSIILALVCRSQNAAELNIPNVLPPSPEAAALNKAGQLSVGLVSGAAQASIPLHEIKLGDVTIPHRTKLYDQWGKSRRAAISDGNGMDAFFFWRCFQSCSWHAG